MSPIHARTGRERTDAAGRPHRAVRDDVDWDAIDARMRADGIRPLSKEEVDAILEEDSKTIGKDPTISSEQFLRHMRALIDGLSDQTD